MTTTTESRSRAMLNKRDEKTLIRLIQSNGVGDVLEAIAFYAFGKIDGESEVWMDIHSFAMEAKAKTRRRLYEEECRLLGRPYDPSEVDV